MKQEIKTVFVDLDGTLVKTDLFAEAAFKFLKGNPLNVFPLVYWLFQGPSFAKAMLARNVKLDVANLPYETELVDYLRGIKSSGHRLVLATATHWRYAHKVASYLGIFDHVLASSAKINLKGELKLAAILKYAPGEKFSYAGDSAADRPIWAAASSNILVDASRRDIRAASEAGKLTKLFQSQHSNTMSFLKEMRVHQWAKNTLVFVPLLTAHAYLDPTTLIKALLAFTCFSLCASGVYFLNDLLDLEPDRNHPRKRYRPIAAGLVSMKAGVAGAIVLPGLAFSLAVITLTWKFVAVLSIYFLLTNAYSFYLKQRSTIDVIVLAVLFTLRVLAGAAAIGVSLSTWLIAFSIFIFTSLAYLKRYIELSASTEDAVGPSSHQRGYSSADSEAMFSLGIANSTASIMVMALFVSNEEVTSVYRSPEILWGLCLLLLIWTNRIWVGARRGKIEDDPLVFAIKDNVSRLIGLGFIIIFLAARHIE